MLNYFVFYFILTLLSAEQRQYSGISTNYSLMPAPLDTFSFFSASNSRNICHGDFKFYPKLPSREKILWYLKG
jgi:hypothetical protein